MLAERLCFIAEDILKDLQASNVLDLLNQASSLASSRGTMSDQQYAASVQPIRTRASEIRSNSKLLRYPKEIKELIFGSSFASSTPERLADVVLSGLPPSRSLGIASSEFQVYIQRLQQLTVELTALASAGRAFHLQPVTVPDSKISLDVQIPRIAIADETTPFFNVMLRFSRVMTTLSELVTGTAESPILTYTSTTDPVTGFTVVLTTAGAVLLFYKQLLEVAEKQLNLLKTLRDFRKSGLPAAETVETSLTDMIDKNFEEAVEKTVAKLDHQVDALRVVEITVALKKDGRSCSMQSQMERRCLLH